MTTAQAINKGARLWLPRGCDAVKVKYPCSDKPVIVHTSDLDTLRGVGLAERIVAGRLNPPRRKLSLEDRFVPLRKRIRLRDAAADKIGVRQ